MALLALIAAVLQAASFSFDKLILSIKRVTYKTYVGISFPLIFFMTLIIFLIFKTPLSLSLFSGKFLWLLIASIFLAIVSNLLFYRALDEDKLSEIQTIDLLKNIPLIIFSGIIFVNERNFLFIILATISSIAIIWSHWQRHHFQLAKKTMPYLIWKITLAPFVAIISKVLLDIWNPVSLELVRSGVIALILGPMFFRYSKKVSLKAFSYLLITNALTSVAWILYYFSYQISGIVYTVLIFSLEPLLVYFASIFLLKERINWKKFVAFIIVLLSIALSKIV